MEMSYKNTKTPYIITENIKYMVKNLNFNSLKNHFRKLAQLFLETFQSNLK